MLKKFLLRKRKTTLVFVLVISLLVGYASFVFYGANSKIRIKGLIMEVDYTPIFTNYFSGGDEVVLQRDFLKFTNTICSSNSRYSILKGNYYLCKADEWYSYLGLKVDSKIQKMVLKHIYHQEFFEDSIMGCFLIVEKFPLDLFRRKLFFTSEKTDLNNDSVKKEIRAVVSATQKKFNVNDYYFYRTVASIEFNFSEKDSAYSYKINNIIGPEYFQLDATVEKYVVDLKYDMDTVMRKNGITDITLQTILPVFSPVAPPGS